MGQVALPSSGVAYFDACTLIYAVEKIEPYYTAILPVWNALADGRQPVATSELALLEVLVKPLRDGDQTLADLYRRVLLGTSGLTCSPIGIATVEKAAELRAAHRLRTPDAIHAATAIESGCTLFVTNDHGFRRVPGLIVAVLDEVIAS